MPCQHFLNATFAADAATQKFAEIASALPIDSLNADGDYAAAQNDAMTKNLDIMSGRKGWQVIREGFGLLSSYTAGHWVDISLPRDRMFDLACGLVQSISELYFRLVFPYEVQPKFQIFAAASCVDADAAAAICTPILELDEKCPSCVDPFARTWR